MALFEQILGAIDNPNQQASPDQLASVLGAVQQLATSGGVDPVILQGAMSTVGSQVRSTLQQKRATEGSASVDALVNQFAGFGANPAAVQALLSPQQQQQIVQAVSQKTGLDPQLVATLLPALVPLALKLLNLGSPQTGSSPAPAQAGGNPVLNAFLDADGDGDVDLADTLAMAGRFVQKR